MSALRSGQPVHEVSTITLTGALVAAEAALERAAQTGAAVVAVVLDASGDPVVVLRMDGVGTVAVDNATAKARAALTFRRSTLELSDYFRQDQMLGPPMTARSSILAVEGGQPLRAGDAVVGALGVSGAHHSVDDDISAAGADAFGSRL